MQGEVLLPKHTYDEVVEDVDKALKDVGELGKFQYLKILQYASLLVFGSFMIYPISFYQLQPQYLCAVDDGSGNAVGAWFKCTNNQFCKELGGNAALLHKIDWKQETSLNNWITEMNMTCATKTDIGSLGVIAALGGGVGFVILPRFSDFWGRKFVVFVSALITVVFMALPVEFQNENLLKVALAVGSFAAAGRVVIGFAYMQDFMREKGVNFATPFTFFIDGLVTAAAAAYFQYISKEWRWLMAGAAVPLFLATLSLCCSSESIKYLHDTGAEHPERFDEIRDILTRIGHMNGKLKGSQRYEKRFAVEVGQNLEMQILKRLQTHVYK